MSDLTTINVEKINVKISSGEHTTTVSRPSNQVTVSLPGTQGPPGPAPAWGNISGTLSDQTDLQNALDAKLAAADINIIEQAKAGKKTFDDIPPTLITIDDHGACTNISITINRTAGEIDSTVQVFNYAGQVWTYTNTIQRVSGKITTITPTITKV